MNDLSKTLNELLTLSRELSSIEGRCGSKVVQSFGSLPIAWEFSLDIRFSIVNSLLFFLLAGSQGPPGERPYLSESLKYSIDALSRQNRPIINT